MYNIKRLLHVKGKKHVSATEVRRRDLSPYGSFLLASPRILVFNQVHLIDSSSLLNDPYYRVVFTTSLEGLVLS